MCATVLCIHRKHRVSAQAIIRRGELDGVDVIVCVEVVRHQELHLSADDVGELACIIV